MADVVAELFVTVDGYASGKDVDGCARHSISPSKCS